MKTPNKIIKLITRLECMEHHHQAENERKNIYNIHKPSFKNLKRVVKQYYSGQFAEMNKTNIQRCLNVPE